MGGRGSAGNSSNQNAGINNAIMFPSANTKKFSGWDYRGFVQAAAKIEGAAEKATTNRQRQAVYSAARRQIASIDEELKRPEGNAARLRGAKYRLSNVMSSIAKKGI